MGQNQGQNQKKKLPAKNFLEMLKGSSDQRKQSKFERTAFGQEQYLRGIFAEKVKRSEKELYNGKTRQLEKKTRVLLEQTQKELKELKKSRAVFQEQVEKAIFMPPEKPSPYFISFLLHIRRIIARLREAINNSATWLEAQDQRKSKKGAFWNTFLNKKKGGSQFLLSSEHYMTRSAG